MVTATSDNGRQLGAGSYDPPFSQHNLQVVQFSPASGSLLHSQELGEGGGRGKMTTPKPAVCCFLTSTVKSPGVLYEHAEA